MAKSFYKLRVSDVQQETPQCVAITFDVPASLKDEFAFNAGQHLTLRTQINGDEVRRSYSICCAPTDNQLQVAVKQVPEGVFSSFANQELEVGDEIEVMPPTGRFYTPLEAENEKRYLMIAAGSGITPIISLIKTTLIEEPHSSIVLLYGNKTRADIIFKEELAALKNQYVDRLLVTYLFSQEELEASLLQGRLNGERLTRLLDTTLPGDIDDAFICGPEEMMLDLRETLLNRGLEAKQVHVELFGTANSARKNKARAQVDVDSASTSSVRLTIDGVTKEFKLHAGETVLEAALRQGADLPYACKGGVCTTCKAHLEKGEVEMDVNYGLEPDEVEAGLILTCQSHPKTPVLVVNYDVR